MIYDLYRRVRLKLYGAYDGSVDIVALHSHKLLYFAVPKVANTSIKVALSKAIDPELQAWAEENSKKTSFLRDPELRPNLYRRRILLNKFAAEKYRSYERWAFVRNPWDRLVSCYSDKVMRDIVHDGMAESFAKHAEYRPEMPFEDFARTVCRMSETEANRHFRSQYTFLVDRRGKLFPQQIGHFETLGEDFDRMCRGFGIGDITLPTYKATKHRDYRDYYTPSLRDEVAQRYRQDIDLFGYSF